MKSATEYTAPVEADFSGAEICMDWARFIDPISGLLLRKSPRPVHIQKISGEQSSI